MAKKRKPKNWAEELEQKYVVIRRYGCDLSPEQKNEVVNRFGKMMAHHEIATLQLCGYTDESDMRAMHAAEAAGLRIFRKKYDLSFNNCGGYQLQDNNKNIVAGDRLQLTSEDVIEFCRTWKKE
jgi:hypothetical protein